MAKHFGAEVTAVDLSIKHAMLHALGADHVLDYTRDDFPSEAGAYDVVFDVVGKGPFSDTSDRCERRVATCFRTPGYRSWCRGIWTSVTTNKKVIFRLPGGKSQDLAYLRELIEAGKVRPVIDRRFPLEQMSGGSQVR